MKNPKKVTGSGFGAQSSVWAGENGFEKLHRRPDDERIVLEVMQEIKRIFQSHDLSFFNGQQVLLEQSVRQILNFERERPIVIPLPPGYDKIPIAYSLTCPGTRNSTQAPNALTRSTAQLAYIGI